MKYIVSLITCFSIALYSMGCYSLQTVNKEETANAPNEKIVKIIKTNGAEIMYDESEIDSTRSGEGALKTYMKNSVIDRASLDSIQLIYANKINWPRTGIMVMFTLPITIPLIAFIKLVFSKKGVG